LDGRDREAGLARARHADDEAVGEEVGRIEVEAGAEGPGPGIDFLAEIEAGHGSQYRPSSEVSECPWATTASAPRAGACARESVTSEGRGAARPLLCGLAGGPCYIRLMGSGGCDWRCDGR